METTPDSRLEAGEPPGEDATDRRMRAFLAVCDLDRLHAAEVVARRPGKRASWEAREAVQRDPARALRDLLVGELLDLEAKAAGSSRSSLVAPMTAAEFYLRRRRLTRLAELRRAVEGLPRLWSVLAALPASDVVNRCAEIGLDVIALATRSLSRERIAPLLAPLGRDRALAVLARKRDADADERASLAAVVRGAFEIAARTREQSRLAAYVGRRAIATLHRALAPAVRDALVRMSRSNIAQKLESTPPLLVATADRAWLESVVTRAILGPFDGFKAPGGGR